MKDKWLFNLCDGECKLAKEVGPEVHERMELAMLAGIGAAEAFRRGSKSKSMRGFRRRSIKVALGLFRGVGCLAAYADLMAEPLRELRMLERMLEATDEKGPQS